jgi:chromosome segregation ATPase
MRRYILVIITILAIGLLTGCSKDNSAAQHKQDLADIENVLKPYMAKYDAQLAELKSTNTKLQGELATARQQLADAQKAQSAAQSAQATAQSQVSGLNNQIKQLATEYANAATALQSATNKAADMETKYIYSQNSVAQMQAALNAKQASYDALQSKLTRVNARNDTIINEYVAASKTTFYTLWDKWWSVVILENN